MNFTYKIFSIIILALFVCVGVVYAATNSPKFSRAFIKHFKECDTYTETITSFYEGNTYTTTRNIKGWLNGACRYKENVKSAIGEYNITCSFPEIQLEELTESMKIKSKKESTFKLDLYAQVKDEKTGKMQYSVVGDTIIKGTPAVITWAKYQNNPYFCTATKVEK